jgi:hypothetical protein
LWGCSEGKDEGEDEAEGADEDKATTVSRGGKNGERGNEDTLHCRAGDEPLSSSSLNGPRLIFDYYF